MLVSQLIEKLENLEKERGDLPVYYKSEYDTLTPLTSPWVEIVDEDQAGMSDELGCGEPIICVG
jgi:hypothetical protein